MPDGAILLGPTREILWFNRKAAQWLGLRKKIDYGIRIDNLIRHPRLRRLRRGRGQGLRPAHTHAATRDRWFEFNLVTTATWELQLLIVRDVTNESRLEPCAAISSPTRRTSCVRP